MAVSTAPRRRDAERSRAAILDAAEALFAARGYDGVSLQEVAGAAGVSRATPSYFFTNKEGLYGAVLERVFMQRDAATHAAFAPVRTWADDPDGDAAGLRRALTRAVGEYLDFLSRRSAFVALVAWEGLHGGRRLQATPRESSAMQEAFAAVARAGRRHGTAPFDPGDAVLLAVSLTFSPLAQQGTFLTTLGRDLGAPAARRRHVRLVVDQLMHLVARPRGGRTR